MSQAATLLTATEAAILQCLTAQNYSVAGRQKAMAQLADLKAFRAELLEEIAAESDSGGSMASLGTVGAAR